MFQYQVLREHFIWKDHYTQPQSADKIFPCSKVNDNIVLEGGMMAPQRSPATNLLLPGAFNLSSRAPTPVGFQQGPRTPTANLMSPPGNVSKVWTMQNISLQCSVFLIHSFKVNSVYHIHDIASKVERNPGILSSNILYTDILRKVTYEMRVP